MKTFAIVCTLTDSYGFYKDTKIKFAEAGHKLDIEVELSKLEANKAGPWAYPDFGFYEIIEMTDNNTIDVKDDKFERWERKKRKHIQFELEETLKECKSVRRKLEKQLKEIRNK